MHGPQSVPGFSREITDWAFYCFLKPDRRWEQSVGSFFSSEICMRCFFCPVRNWHTWCLTYDVFVVFEVSCINLHYKKIQTI